VYPYEGQTDVPLTMFNEIPNTTPKKDEDQIVGFPIVVKFDSERTYDLTDFTAILRDSSGQTIPYWLIQPSDKSYRIGGDLEIWLMSRDLLKPNETYSVESEGIRRGKRQ
jgi:hypothetical protein